LIEIKLKIKLKEIRRINMLNFIVCEDNKFLLEKNAQIINNLMFNNNINYIINTYNCFNKDLEKEINSDNGFKIYILDIELGNYSGIDIVRLIRKNDWNSIVIISTAHDELFNRVFSDNLLIFAFISKFDDYEKNLKNCLTKALEIINIKKFLKFNINKNFYFVKFNEILYLKFDKSIRKTIIKTINNEYSINKPLNYFVDQLDDNFFRINKSYIINLINVKEINYKDEIIVFNNIILENIKINKKEIDLNELL